MLRLLTVPNPTGAAFGGWRHPGGWPDNMVMNLSQSIAIAKTAERGKFDGLFLADGNGVRQLDRPELFKALKESDRPAVFEPVTLYAALSQQHRTPRVCGDRHDDLRGALSPGSQVRLARPPQRPVGRRGTS